MITNKKGKSIIKMLNLIAMLLFAPSLLWATSIQSFINKPACDQILDKGYYKICYDYGMKAARYVAYVLDGNLVNAVNIKKRPKFYPDASIPKQYRAYPDSYRKNKFSADRGHMYPDAAADFSRKSLHSAYSMANIIPQYSKINRGKNEWAGAERYARYVAHKLGSVSVINGVIYGSNPPRMGREKIAYPYAYWKMIYNDSKNFKRCFYFRNGSRAYDWKHDRLKNHLMDCNAIRSGRQ